MAYGSYNTRNFTSGINRNFTGMRPQGGATGSRNFISGKSRLNQAEVDRQSKKQADYMFKKWVEEKKAPGKWGRGRNRAEPYVAGSDHKWGPEGTYYTNLLNQHMFPDWAKKNIKDKMKKPAYDWDARVAANKAKFGKYGLGIGATPDMREKEEKPSPFSRIETHKGV